MIIEVATAAWVCFAGVICYDSANVATAGDEVATILTDGEDLAALIVNCRLKTHQVSLGGETAEGTFEPNSIAAMLCNKYLPQL